MLVLNKILWYLMRPRLYPHLGRLMLRKVSPAKLPHECTHQEAISWCEGLAITVPEALRRICGSHAHESLEDEFPDVLSRARQRVDACPAEMGGAANLDILYQLAEACAAKKVVETGVAYGWSSLALLLSLQKRQGSRLVSTDMPYPTRNNDRHVGCAVPENLRTNWTLLNYADRQAIPKALKILGGSIDLCHYDSDKSYHGRMWAYQRLWDALRTGGYFISDDIGDNIAFRDFAKSVGVEPTIVRSDDKHVGILVKDTV